MKSISLNLNLRIDQIFNKIKRFIFFKKNNDSEIITNLIINSD